MQSDFPARGQAWDSLCCRVNLPMAAGRPIISARAAENQARRGRVARRGQEGRGNDGA